MWDWSEAAWSMTGDNAGLVAVVGEMTGENAGLVAVAGGMFTAQGRN